MLGALWVVPWSTCSASLRDSFSYRANDLATLRRGFAHPPREAGPWVYWFWWNNVVSREEIERELEEMAAAGIAGAELRVVTLHGWGGEPLAGMDNANLERLGHRQLRCLSDEWVETLAFTCATAERLGLRLVMNLGQGWPPGGLYQRPSGLLGPVVLRPVPAAQLTTAPAKTQQQRGAGR